MTTLNTLYTGSLIDAAFLAPTRPTDKAYRRFGDTQEKAMARRLEQLQAALGDEADAAPQPSAPLSGTIAVRDRRTASLARTLVACLLSAALGASAMWLALGDASGTSATVNVSPTAMIASPAASMAERPPAPVAQGIPDETQIGELVESWRQAWQNHDLAAYLAAYGADFTPADGSSRDAWVAARSRKLAGNATIEVQLHNLVIERLAHDRFSVSFRQDYASGSYRETGRGKTLQVAREDGEWKIVREQQTR